MRRAVRHCLTIGSVLSVLLCAGILALWARSYWASDHLITVSPLPGVTITSAWGVMTVSWYDTESPITKYYTSRAGQRSWVWISNVNSPDTGPPRRLRELLLDFQINRGEGIVNPYVRCPHWALALAAALPAPLLVSRWRQRRRARVGLCPACGYDLRASPERCPECGTVAVSQPATTTAARR